MTNPDSRQPSPNPSEAVARWLNTPVRTCPACGQPIYPTDPRAFDAQVLTGETAALVHLHCLLPEQPNAQPC
jgi:hypothetical protein